ncbi:MAG: DUF2267 domain-containing protein [bacterium]|nr:DUF2267 domain-containing protein [bacterium]
MPVPSEYQRASQQFEKFMLDACEVSGLVTTHMAYNMVVGVLHTFRRRLSIRDALRFANALPPVLRALFVADWDADEPQRDFGDIASMTKEVKALRAAHNFSPDTAIHDVAVALRRNVNEGDFDQLLSTLPEGAREYWSV